MTRPLHTRSAVELGQLLHHGETTSVAIVEALHERADEVEPKVGAFAHQLRRSALEEATRADEAKARGESLGPLHGLPITIKENIDIEGLPTTIGLRSRSGHLAGEDAVVVRLLRAAGAVILGKTNVPQTLLAPMETTNSLFGTTHNPWRHGHGPGGSSGGEAAAIASGTSIFGVGTDIGGSIRVPASFCGLCGLKPTRHRWSNRGSNGLLPGQELVQSQTGPMARTVDDLILLMRALDTPSHTPFDPRVPPVALGEPGAVDGRRLRIGFYEDDGFLKPAASVRRAVREAAALFEAAGCDVVRFTPPNVEELVSLYFRGVTADGSATVVDALGGEPFVEPLKTLGRLARMPTQARRGLGKALGLMGEHRVQVLLDAIGEKRVKEYWEVCARRTELQLDEERVWALAGVDVVLAPAFATTAAPIGMSHDFTLGFASSARYNLLDRPAGVVPITRVRPDELQRTSLRDRLDKRAAQIEAESAGLPVGVQLVGKPWREAELLSAMRLLHLAAGASQHFPATPVDPV